jgi:hypothetical protein
MKALRRGVVQRVSSWSRRLPLVTADAPGKASPLINGRACPVTTARDPAFVPTQGCWELTGGSPGRSLSFVVLVSYARRT